MIETISPSQDQYVEMTADQFARQITEVAVPLVSKQAADKFDAVLKNVVRRQLGKGEAADKALESGSLLMNGMTVVMRLNRENDSMEFFVDMGLPDSSADHAQ